ncbi:autotransporter outer membrane beta-barrel domain-containing protein [Pasteurella atlantica]|uniref:autotransporter outer membrane beta-barrel domain-containing protein n=2 Tax=Pasteurella atlantica TaxID=2827233 RepID=UPI00274CD1F3|nr:autotransporter outer membrane beta-barrel domain-containing protein [Pasteurella atlantica]MDP8157118.1 autotransporter outer membrane beta-barrel domain-containing protein [Pasteurella atlantica]
MIGRFSKSPKNNSVEVIDTKGVSINNVIGSFPISYPFSLPFISNNDTTYNTVTIKGGHIGQHTITSSSGFSGSSVYGGISAFKNSNNNKVIVNDGIIDGDIYGGTSKSGNAENNIIEINGGTVGYDVSGGDGDLTGGYSLEGNANNNTVKITGGKMAEDVYGGYAGAPGYSHTGNANSNSIMITGGQVDQQVVGGKSILGNAINNTLTIKGGQFGKETIFYGGYTGVGKGDVRTGNKLNLHKSGFNIKNIANFEDINFYVQSDTKKDETFLTLSDTNGTDISDTRVGVAVEGSSLLNKGDEVILIKQTGGDITFPSNMDNHIEGMQGTAVEYTFKLHKDDNKTFIACALGQNVSKCDPKITKWLDLSGTVLKNAEKADTFLSKGIDPVGYSYDGMDETSDARIYKYYKPKTTKWIDFDGKEIQTTVTGKDFAEAGKFDGYHISKTKVSDDGLTKTYILGKVINAGLIDPIAYKVKTTKWVDFDGKEIQTTVTGKDFAEAGKFDGYHISKTKVSDDGLTKTYILGKVINAGLIDPNLAYKVKTTKWVDFDGKEIQTTVTGKDFAEAGKFDGYHISKTKVSDDGLTKTYILGKVINAGLIDPSLAYKVKTTKWVDFDGKEIQTTVTGKDFAEAGKFDGYHISKTTVSDDGLTKTYILGKVINAGLIDPNLAYKVKTTKWVDFEGKEVQTTVTGKDFAEAGKFDGYHISKTKVSDDGLTKTYILGKVIKAGLIDPNLAYKVKTTKWIDFEGKEVQTTVTGKDFAEAGKFDGYHISKTKVSDDGLTKTYILGKVINAGLIDPNLAYKVKTTKWVDFDGKEIQTTVTGKDFAEAGKFDGYHISKTKVSDDGLTKTYILGKVINAGLIDPNLAYKVKTTKWIDFEGKEVQTTVTGKDFAEAGKFDGYHISKTTISDDGLTKTYILGKVINAGLIDPNLAYKVKTTKWIDFEGKEIQTTVTGKDFAEAGKFDGYHISKTKVSDDGLTKTYILGKVIKAGLIDPNLAYKVKTTKWLDNEGNEIQTAVKGKDFEEQGVFIGYDFNEVSVSDDGLTKTYIFGKLIDTTPLNPDLSYKVKTTKWLDSEGKEIQTAVTGKDFEEQGVFIGYDFNEVKVSDDGLTKTYIFGKLIDTTPLNPDLAYKVKTTKWLDDEGNEIQATVVGKDFEEQGIFVGYDFNEVKVSADGLTKTYIFKKQNVINNVAGRVAKQTESYLNTGIVGIEFVNHGFDLTNSLMDNGLNLNNNLHGFKAFGTIDSSKWTVNYTDLDSFNMVTGVGAIKNNNIFGAFIEAGSGQYHSKTMTKDNIVFSNGNSRYYGIGMLFQTKLNAIYLTSSAKLGKSITSYKSSNIKGAKNNKVNFTSKRNYAGMTLKGAYTAFPNYSINVTPYIEGSYLYFGKDNVMIENQNFTFNKIESLETGVGIKLKGYINNHINIYTDAKWIREYRGIAQGKVLGLDMPSVNVRGDTQSLKVGLDVNFNNNFYMDINMNKSFGIHRGMNTGLLFMYNY